ncbi:unnamed protein product [Tetraodon nigroviridis]|uniref:(spotted green pufferfish) hypothetical protein n=1 Tax=Tetraodon nigroviridis TaxID=99883 RepID=Q4T6C5_TETNG|nr:unnamed protein product [Tetraodon nigroviridis]
MGIQRAGYQTVQSAGKIQNVPLAHLELAVAAEDKRWLLADIVMGGKRETVIVVEAVIGQVKGEDAKSSGQQVPGERAAVTSC